MKYKKLLFTFSFLLANLVLFSQQIGNGFAPAAINDFNKELLSGFYQGYNALGEVDGGGWNHLLNLRHSDPGNNHQLQIVSSYAENDKLFFRKFARGLGSNNPVWHEIATRGGNTFNGNQSVNGTFFVSTSSQEGGKLSLVNPSKSSVNGATEWAFYNMTGGYGNSLQFWNYGSGFNEGPKFTILDGGNVGIGTQQPSSKLQINGGITLPVTAGITETSEEGISPIANHRFNYDGKYLNHYGFGFYSYSKSYDPGGINTYMAGYYGVDFFTNDTNRMKILFNGNVGIGTVSPDQKLTVNGTIHSKEVIVDTNIAPDYVFQKYYTGKSELKSDYRMPTLTEIEDFTRKNNHLPNVPSAKEMQENGILVGEMSNVLLQKVEELTLYIIEQQKELERLKKENSTQSKKIEDMERENENFQKLAMRITEIENRLK